MLEFVNVNRLFYTGIFSVLLLFAPTTALPLTARECLVAVRRIAYRISAEERRELDKEFLIRYRNDDRFAAWLLLQPSDNPLPSTLVQTYLRDGGVPLDKTFQPIGVKTIHLDNYGSKLSGRIPPSFWHRNVGAWLAPLAPHLDLKAEAYRETVLSLRAGDTVMFGEKSFKLGKFLGAGNATHVFEIDGFPDRVIRIPFVIEALAGANHPRDFMRRFVWDQPWSAVNRVRILERGTGYAVVSRVTGKETGLDFFRSQSEKFSLKKSERYNQEWTDSVVRGARQIGDAQTVEKAEKLALQMQKRWFLPRTSRRWWKESRQFVWDIEKRDWYLVDWE